MKIEDEAKAYFMACDDAHQALLLNILKRTSLRAPRRPAAKLSLAFSRSRGDDLRGAACAVKDEATTNVI